MSPWLAALALASSVVGLRLSWGIRAWRAASLAFAVVAFAASVAIVSANVGAERAVAIALIAVTVPAYAVVLANATRRPRRVGGDRTTQSPDGRMELSKDLFLRWLVAGPVAAIAALALSAAILAWLPGAAALRTVLAVLTMPLLWMLLAGWGLATRRIYRVLIWLVIGSVGGSAAVGALLFA